MLLLTGPTACGKSDVALALAKRTGGEVVCADAFQLYACLPVLTAQPSAADMTAVPHHLYGSVPLTEDMDAAKFARMARECVAEIESRGRLAIVTGGSGLYIKAFTHGLSPLPPADAALRAKLDALTAEERVTRLLAQDPAAGESVPLANPRYVQRALEIALLTGRPVAEQRQSFAAGPRPGIRGIFLQRDRDELYARINARTLAMLEHGALDEVRALPPDISATAAKTIGLRELRAVLAGEMTLAEATATIQQTTRRYAKRQVTWFRRETWMETVPCGGRTAEEIAVGVQALAALGAALS
jgi:tRNA dimethylallyltransferase